MTRSLFQVILLGAVLGVVSVALASIHPGLSTLALYLAMVSVPASLALRTSGWVGGLIFLVLPGIVLVTDHFVGFSAFQRGDIGLLFIAPAIVEVLVLLWMIASVVQSVVLVIQQRA